VASASTRPPIRTRLPAEIMRKDAQPRSHSDWLFVYAGSGA